jgi:hypothetical protein
MELSWLVDGSQSILRHSRFTTLGVDLLPYLSSRRGKYLAVAHMK